MNSISFVIGEVERSFKPRMFVFAYTAGVPNGALMAKPISLFVPPNLVSFLPTDLVSFSRLRLDSDREDDAANVDIPTPRGRSMGEARTESGTGKRPKPIDSGLWIAQRLPPTGPVNHRLVGCPAKLASSSYARQPSVSVVNLDDRIC